MSQIDSATVALINSFKDVVGLCIKGGPRHQEHFIEHAVAALQDITAVAHNWARQADIRIALFPVHGPEHHQRLGKLALDFLCAARPHMPDKSALFDVKTLVLLFSAFVMHDIGMGVKNVQDTPRSGGRSSQDQRKDHDKRSLEFIERQLIDVWDSGIAPARSPRLDNWAAFWEKVATSDWPESPKYWAAYLLARVCQSHADPKNTWLSERSFESYHRQVVTPNAAIVNLKNLWVPKCWAEEIAPTVLAAGTLLCLCDLCDVGPGRFATTPNEWLSEEFPDSPDKARQSFLHWGAHQLCEPTFEANRVVVRVGKAGAPLRVLALPIVAGPVPTLIRWGSLPSMNRNLRTHVNSSFSSVDLAPGPALLQKWHQVLESAQQPPFAEAWKIPGLECLTRGDGTAEEYFQDEVLNPHWWSEVVEYQKPHNWDRIKGPLGTMRTALLARESGLPYEEIVTWSHVAQAAPVTFVYPVTEPDISGQLFCDGLFAALRLARDLIFDDPLNHWRVIVLVKGTELYERFTSANPVVDEYRHSILVCPLIDSADIDHYKGIIQLVADRFQHIKAIFFGLSACWERMKGSHSSVAYTTNSDLISALYRIASSTASNDGAGPTPGTSFTGDGPPSIYGVILLRSNSVRFLEEVVLDGIERKERSHEVRAFGTYVLLTLFDMLDYQGHVTVSQVKREYDRARRTMADISFCSIEEPLSILGRRQGAIRVVGDTIYFDTEYTELSRAREFITSQSRKLKLLEIVLILVLQRTQTLHSLHPALPLFDPVPTPILDKAVGFVVNTANEFAARARLALFLGERLGLEVAEGLRDAPAALTVIVDTAQAFKIDAVEDLARLDSVLCHQMAYRFGRRALSSLVDLERGLPALPATVLLGLLEAVGSSEVSEQADSEQGIARVAQLIVEQLCHGLSTQRQDTELQAAVGFDTLYKYRGANSLIEKAGDGLWREGSARGWQSFAEFFHRNVDSPHDRPESAPEQQHLVSAWQKFRMHLLEIVKRYTPPELARRAPAPTRLAHS